MSKIYTPMGGKEVTVTKIKIKSEFYVLILIIENF